MRHLTVSLSERALREAGILSVDLQRFALFFILFSFFFLLLGEAAFAAGLTYPTKYLDVFHTFLYCYCKSGRDLL